MGNSYITDAICLKTHDYSESSQILHLFTADQGAIRAVAKGIRRPKSRLSGSAQLFQVSTFQCVRGKNLDTVTQYRPVQSFSSVGTDLLASGLACGCADVLRWAVPEHDPHCEEVFNTFRDYLLKLDSLSSFGAKGLPDLLNLSSASLSHASEGSREKLILMVSMVALTMDALLTLSDALGLAPSLHLCPVCHEPVLVDGQPKRFSLPLHGVVHSECQPQAELMANHTKGWARLNPATFRVLHAPLTDVEGWEDLKQTPFRPLRFMVYYLSSVLEHSIPAFDVAFSLQDA